MSSKHYPGAGDTSWVVKIVKTLINFKKINKWEKIKKNSPDWTKNRHLWYFTATQFGDQKIAFCTLVNGLWFFKCNIFKYKKLITGH